MPARSSSSRSTSAASQRSPRPSRCRRCPRRFSSRSSTARRSCSMVARASCRRNRRPSGSPTACPARRSSRCSSSRAAPPARPAQPARPGQPARLAAQTPAPAPRRAARPRHPGLPPPAALPARRARASKQKDVIGMTTFLMFFPIALLVLTMVAYRGFGATLLRWIWDQKVILAVVVALAATVMELIGLSSVLSALPQVAMLAFQLLFAMVFMVVQFGAMMWIMSRPRVYWRMPGEETLTWDDYVGNPVVKQLISEVADNINTNNAFARMKGTPSRGVLFTGPPGTGKSYAARIIASVCNVPFCYCDAASLQSAFMGMGSMTVNRLYGKARKLARKHGACIMFLDEIDAIGAARSKQGTGMGMIGGMMMGGGTGLLNTLLNNLDPIATDGGWMDRVKRRLGFPVPAADKPYVLTMAATNLPESLDEALVRDGRFDLQIIVDLPDVDGREEQFEMYLTKVICTNKAVAEAARAGRNAVTMADIEAARRTKSFGVKQPLRSMPRHENRRVAYHEGGHAIVGALFRKHMKVEYATIIRRDRALGLVASAFENERHTVTRQELINDIRVALASRAVEIEILGEPMSGFSGDLAAATMTSAQMIMVYGMDDMLVSAMAIGGGAVPVTKVNRMLQREMALVRAFVRHNKEAVEAFSELLLEREEMDGDEIYAFLEQYFPGCDGEGYLADHPEIAATAREIEAEYVKSLEDDPFKTTADVIVNKDEDKKGAKAHGWEPFSVSTDGAVHTWARKDHMAGSCCRSF